MEDVDLFQNETSSRIPLKATSSILTSLSLLKSNFSVNHKLMQFLHFSLSIDDYTKDG